MSLFIKLIDVHVPFHLTLMNIAFCNLTDKPKNSIQHFLSPTKSKLSADDTCNTEKLDIKDLSHNLDLKKGKSKPASKGIMDFFQSKQNTVTCEVKTASESENRDSDRKRRIDDDVVQNLTKKSKFEDVNLTTHSNFLLSSAEHMDRDVFNQLPPDIQKEVVQNSPNIGISTKLHSNISKASTSLARVNNQNNTDNDELLQINPENKVLKEELLTVGINVDDFFTFPQEIQKDILDQYKISTKQVVSEKKEKKSILNFFTAKNK